MKSPTYSTLLLLFIFPVLCSAQGKKTIKNLHLKSQTVYEYFIAEGLKDPVIESIEVYDSTGNVIEFKEFSSEGDIKNWQTFKYDENDNKIEETTFDNKGRIEERIEWIYKNELVVEKKYFDHKNRLTKRKEYKYAYRQD